MTEKQFYSPEEVAEKLSLSRTQIYRYINSGKLKTHRFGKRAIRISEEDLQEFLKQHKKK
jgi:excisionase family DNA binding protein